MSKSFEPIQGGHQRIELEVGQVITLADVPEDAHRADILLDFKGVVEARVTLDGTTKPSNSLGFPLRAEGFLILESRIAIEQFQLIVVRRDGIKHQPALQIQYYKPVQSSS